jgi:hypothetical protein
MPSRAAPRDSRPTVAVNLAGPPLPRRAAGWRYRVHRARSSVTAIVVAYLVACIVLLGIGALLAGRG